MTITDIPPYVRLILFVNCYMIVGNPIPRSSCKPVWKTVRKLFEGFEHVSRIYSPVLLTYNQKINVSLIVWKVRRSRICFLSLYRFAVTRSMKNKVTIPKISTKVENFVYMFCLYSLKCNILYINCNFILCHPVFS